MIKRNTRNRSFNTELEHLHKSKFLEKICTNTNRSFKNELEHLH